MPYGRDDNRPRIPETSVSDVDVVSQTAAESDSGILDFFDKKLGGSGILDKAKEMGGKALDVGKTAVENTIDIAEKLLDKANEVAKKNPIAGAIMTAGVIFGGLWLTKKVVEGAGSLFKSLKDKIPGFGDILKMNKWAKLAGALGIVGVAGFSAKKAWDLLKDEFKDCDTDEKKRAKAKEVAGKLPIPESWKDEAESLIYRAVQLEGATEFLGDSYEKLKKKWDEQVIKIKAFCEENNIDLELPDFAKTIKEWIEDNPGKTATLGLVLSWWLLKKANLAVIKNIFTIKSLAITAVVGTLCTLFFIDDEHKQKLYAKLGLTDLNGDGKIELAENAKAAAEAATNKGIEVLQSLKNKFNGFLEALGVENKTAQNLLSLFVLWKTSKLILNHPKGALQFGTISAVAFALFKIFESKEAFASEQDAIKKAINDCSLKIDDDKKESIIAFFIHPVDSAKKFREENKDSWLFSATIGAINQTGAWIDSTGNSFMEIVGSCAADENGNTNTKQHFIDLQNKINNGEEISKIAEMANFVEALYEDGKEIFIDKGGWAIWDGVKFLTIKFSDNMTMPIISLLHGKVGEAFQVWRDTGGALFCTVGATLGGIFGKKGFIKTPVSMIKGGVKLGFLPQKTLWEMTKTLISPGATKDMVRHAAGRRIQHIKGETIDHLSVSRKLGSKMGIKNQYEAMLKEYDHFKGEIEAMGRRKLTSRRGLEALSKKMKILEGEIKVFYDANPSSGLKPFLRGEEAALVEKSEVLEKQQKVLEERINALENEKAADSKKYSSESEAKTKAEKAKPTSKRKGGELIDDLAERREMKKAKQTQRVLKPIDQTKPLSETVPESAAPKKPKLKVVETGTKAGSTAAIEAGSEVSASSATQEALSKKLKLPKEKISSITKSLGKILSPVIALAILNDIASSQEPEKKVIEHAYYLSAFWAGSKIGSSMPVPPQAKLVLGLLTGLGAIIIGHEKIDVASEWTYEKLETASKFYFGNSIEVLGNANLNIARRSFSEAVGAINIFNTLLDPISEHIPGIRNFTKGDNAMQYFGETASGFTGFNKGTETYYQHGKMHIADWNVYVEKKIKDSQEDLLSLQEKEAKLQSTLEKKEILINTDYIDKELKKTQDRIKQEEGRIVYLNNQIINNEWCENQYSQLLNDYLAVFSLKEQLKTTSLSSLVNLAEIDIFNHLDPMGQESIRDALKKVPESESKQFLTFIKMTASMSNKLDTYLAMGQFDIIFKNKEDVFTKMFPFYKRDIEVKALL